ncbi:type VI secretion system-associated FHA domain protein [Photobacterium nomapromontoriensis]|uniref:type VI secretion system-associated FHA domain protein n=1 Tax=Photobacterium nomapromontoriensis TaxID=2910237 RepID=UPI003D0CE232
MRLNQLVLLISKCPEEYIGVKNIEMPDTGGSIGRAASCTLSLADHNRFISGTHCLVSVYGDTYYISDVSTNGTLVNGNKILKNQPVSICDGDILSLGQYEIGISLERIATAQDIAADIAPERISNDPLINLGETVIERDNQGGVLEELFMETKQDDVDSHDPIAHLKFAMQRDDDYLIRNEETSEQAHFNPIDNKRQIADDSFSIHSEFDLPNLIPKDWMANDSLNSVPSAPQETTNPVSKVVSDEQQSNAIPSAINDTETTPGILEQSTFIPQTSAGIRWEEVTQPFTPSTQDVTQTGKPRIETNADFLTDELSKPSECVEVNNLSQAFYEGLGMTNPDLVSNEVLLFKQLGTCLRLCIDNLQKDLHEVEALKEEQSISQPESNLTELMFTLNSQNLLTPNELVEQMLDELNEHQVIFNKALNELLIEQSETNDPTTFANDFSSNKIFTTKSRLWAEYLAFYAKNRRQLHETSLKGLIRSNYNKSIKGSHA